MMTRRMPLTTGPWCTVPSTSDDSLVARVTGFEQLDDARQTAGDVLRLGRGARDLARMSPG
jgi:hypothetical protein